MHADHHIGTITFLLKQKKEPILVIGPPDFGIWLESYNRIEKLYYQFFECSDFNYPEKHFTLKNIPFFFEMQTVPVIHCPDSFAFILKFFEWKLVYSGDTRPCDALKEAGKNSTLLIHEATLEDEMKAEAIEKNHSTTEEAIQIGIEMNAQHIILTHFSQRYPKIPVFNSIYQNHITIAFDLMTLKLSNLNITPQLLPYLCALFKEEILHSDSDDEGISVSKRPTKKNKGKIKNKS